VRTILAAFSSTEAAGNAVSDIIGAGIIPAAVEMMDRLTIEAAEAAVHPNFPKAEAVLIVELDGPAIEVSEQFRQVEDICRQAGGTEMQIARDGNLHPLVCYDESIEGQGDLAEAVASEILTYCIEAGGSITGEHGVGADKSCAMPKMFTPDDLETMMRVRRAFDPFGLCNPD